VFGAGRMARGVLAKINDAADYQLKAVVARSPQEGLPKSGVYASLDAVDTNLDLVIDFTLPGGTRSVAQWCEHNGVALLSGTTGLAEEDISALKKAALKVPVLWAPNMSYGVALVTSLVRQTANAVGVVSNITITDVHHQHKIDAPSGTALALAAAAMEGRSEFLRDILKQDQLDSPADGGKGELAFTSVRQGEVIGEHTVSFALPGEVIEITHKALERDVFANGALKAGKWLVGQQPGYYSTVDWLDSKD